MAPLGAGLTAGQGTQADWPQGAEVTTGRPSRGWSLSSLRPVRSHRLLPTCSASVRPMERAEALDSLSDLSCAIQRLCFQEQKEENSGPRRDRLGCPPGPLYPWWNSLSVTLSPATSSLPEYARGREPAKSHKEMGRNGWTGQFKSLCSASA